MAVTGTNSGKTLCYLLPALQRCFEEPSAKALFVFPTKSLAQDQMGKVSEWIEGTNLMAGVYDGDTPRRQRGPIRRLAHLVATNPDMLHMGILPGHENWIRFLKSLRIVALDEIHSYRGSFGSHMAWVVRRLLRLCAAYGSHPQLVACSATVGNPAQLFGALTGRDAEIVSEDGSPRGRRTFYFVNPPPDDQGRTPSRNHLTAKIVAELAAQNVRTMAFCRSRLGVELVLRYAREIADSRGEPAPDQLESYRSGYTPAERRRIEQDLFQGRILGLATTNAMELGVDIGGLDVVVMNGYPGTVASFWQQAGRAGRAARDGAAVFLAADDPLEQYLANSPSTLLGSELEEVALNPENAAIAEGQLLCMAHERPIAPSELLAISEPALTVAERLDGSGELELKAGRFYYPSYTPPAANVNIRGSGRDEVTLWVGSEQLGTMERWRSFQYAHPGAIYLHRGATYRVEILDVEDRRAQLEPIRPEHYTQSIVQAIVQPLVVIREAPAGRGRIRLCSLKLTTDVTGYRVRSLDGDRVLGEFPLDLPPTTMETVGVRIDLPSAASNEPTEEELGAVHGVEHAALAIAPVLAGCDRSDLGAAWYGIMPDSGTPSVFVFDQVPGGIGLSERLFERWPEWLAGARRLLEGCPCEAGCPRCLYSARCEAANELLDKRAAIERFRAIASDG